VRSLYNKLRFPSLYLLHFPTLYPITPSLTDVWHCWVLSTPVQVSPQRLRRAPCGPVTVTMCPVLCLQTPTFPRRASSSPGRRMGTEAAATTTAATEGPGSVTRTNVGATHPPRRCHSTTAARRGLPRALPGQQCSQPAVATVLQTLWCTLPSVGSRQRRAPPRTRLHSFTSCCI
jgi:hypothetical protein